VRNEMPLGDDLLITELTPPAWMVGRSLADLELPRRHAITVVAIRRAGRGAVFLPAPSDRLEEEDVLVVVSRREAVAQLMERRS
jgi:trk system potassium uptake protein